MTSRWTRNDRLLLGGWASQAGFWFMQPLFGLIPALWPLALFLQVWMAIAGLCMLPRTTAILLCKEGDPL